MMYSGDVLLSDCDGKSAPRLIRQWLRIGLGNAARQAGWSGGEWLIEDVACAIAAYFDGGDRCGNVTLSEIEIIVREMLSTIGYGELAGHFRAAPPVRSVSLPSFVLASRLRGEADFYTRVDVCLRELNAQGIAYLHLHGLAACEYELRVSEGWFSCCSTLGTSEKIVNYIRRRLRILSWPHPFCCTIT